jgi:hypothetical protein
LNITGRLAVAGPEGDVERSGILPEAQRGEEETKEKV